MSAVERASKHAGIDISADQHPITHEKPEDWGWHADFSKLARIGGVISILVLLIGLTSTHYNNAGTAGILLCIGLLVVGLIADSHYRKHSFRR